MVDEVKPAPRRHHGVDAAKQFRGEHAAVYEEPGQQPAAPAPAAPAPAAPAPAAPAPAAPAPAAPAPAAPAPAAPAPAAPAPAAPAPAGTSIFDFVEPAAPAITEDPAQPSERELQLQQEIEELRTQNGQLTAAQQRDLEQRQTEQTELEELRALRRTLEVDRLLNLDNVEFDSLDPAMAQELNSKLVRPLLERQQEAFEKRLGDVTASMAEERKQREQVVSRLTEREQNEVRERTNRSIYAAHPDFDMLRSTKEFQQFLGSAIRGSSLKLEKLVADEYHSGNADFVIQAINEFKKGRPSLEDIASVQVSGTGSEPANPSADEQEFTEEDVAEWNAKVVTGDMSRTEFRDKMAKYRAARAPAK